MNLTSKLLNKIKDIKSTTPNIKITQIKDGNVFEIYTNSIIKKLAGQCKCKFESSDTVLIGWIESNVPSKGYGNILLTYVIQYYKIMNIKTIRALIDTDKNPKSVRLFKSLGFVETVHRNDRTSDWELQLK